MLNNLLFIEIDFSNFPLYKFIFSGIFIFLLIRLIRFVTKGIRIPKKYRKFINKYAPILELIIWILFLAWALRYFNSKNQYLALGLFIVLLSVSIWGTWFALKDYIIGLIFRRESDLTVNEIITTNDITGKIINLKSRSILLETEDGKTIQLPYSKLSENTLEKHQQAETISGYTFNLKVKTKFDSGQIMLKIKEAVMNLPWASIKRNPTIKTISIDNGVIDFEVTVYSIEKSYFFKIENYIREHFVAV